MTKIKLMICLFITYPLHTCCMEFMDRIFTKIGLVDPVDQEAENITAKPHKKDTDACKMKKRKIRIDKILKGSSFAELGNLDTVSESNHFIETIPHVEEIINLAQKIKEQNTYNYYEQILNKLNILKIRTETEQLIKELEADNDTMRLPKAYAIMQKLYDSPEKKAEYQNLIDTIAKENENKLRLQTKEINHTCMITALSEEIKTVSKNSQLPQMTQFDKLAGLLEKRAFVYQQNSHYYTPDYAASDMKKAKELRIQIDLTKKAQTLPS